MYNGSLSKVTVSEMYSKVSSYQCIAQRVFFLFKAKKMGSQTEMKDSKLNARQRKSFAQLFICDI